jgi:hypothetical protein
MRFLITALLKTNQDGTWKKRESPRKAGIARYQKIPIWAYFGEGLGMDSVVYFVAIWIGRVARWYIFNFHTKNRTFGIFWKALKWKMSVFWLVGI